jgi:hypothetical protein
MFSFSSFKSFLLGAGEGDATEEEDKDQERPDLTHHWMMMTMMMKWKLPQWKNSQPHHHSKRILQTLLLLLLLLWFVLSKNERGKPTPLPVIIAVATLADSKSCT